MKIARSPEWAALEAHAQVMRTTHLRTLFADDPARATRMSAEAGDLYVDYSKHLVTDDTMRLLISLAERAGVPERIEAMFAGERINVTEDRAALHVALRAPRDEPIELEGRDVVADVHAVLDRMSEFADRIRSGDWTGATGERIRAVVNIGIGGSDLGPKMAVEALRDHTDRSMIYRFVSNVDGADVAAPRCRARERKAV
jgi:glucose-6-phosphate isomerase